MRSINWGRPLLLLAVPLIALAAHATTTPAPSSSSPGRMVARAGLKSGAVLVIDESDSTVLLSQKADVAAPVASITKLMTALVVLEAKQPLNEELEITKEDRAVDRGSRLAVGTRLSRGDLLHLALMSSENRAANAVGRNYPGGVRGLVREMNAKAKAIGMKHAQFVDATGLSDGNFASPRDLAKLVIAASNNPTIRAYSTDEEHTVMVKKVAAEFRNTNTLVSRDDWDISVQKTGFTSAAGQCLVMKANLQDRPVVMVFLNSWGKYTRVADARRVRRWMESQSAKQQVAKTAAQH
jgi:D-alanyl-D-alanine endopeptidase (penicillin-binding protein 7)